MATAPTRRSVLAVLGAGFSTLLVGCEDSPGPAVSTATPGPSPSADEEPQPSTQAPEPTATDSTALALALERAQELAATCRSITGVEGWRVAAQQQVQQALDEQVRVIEAVLQTGAEAAPEPTTPGLSEDRATGTAGQAATGPTPGDREPGTGAPGDAAGRTSASPAEQAAAQLAALGRACRQDVTPEALSLLSEVTEVNLPMLVAIAGQRGATAQLFGQSPGWRPLQGPTGQPAAALLEVFRPAEYGFEVLAARAQAEERTTYEEVLSELRVLTGALTELAGPAAPPAPLGYGLPEGSSGPEGRARLAGRLLAALPPTIMGQSGGLAGDQAAVAGLVRLLADSVWLGHPWHGVPAFPGMQVPGA